MRPRDLPRRPLPVLNPGAPSPAGTNQSDQGWTWNPFGPEIAPDPRPFPPQPPLPRPAPHPPAPRPAERGFTKIERPRVSGKWITVSGETFWVRGVTYGTFGQDSTGNEFHDRDVVEWDLARISGYGFNAIRTYTVPPPWMLQLAYRYGLRVMIGIPWEQHVAFLDDRRLPQAIEDRVR